MIDSVFSTLTSNVPLHCLYFLRAASFFMDGNLDSGFMSVRTYFFLSPSLWNTSPSILLLSPCLRLGDADMSRCILENTLVGFGLLDMLRERLGFSLLLISPLLFGVLDLEYCDV
nr:hypothetical protein [Tanacetum cinerariifolium]